jgi:hypothetical protein
MVPDPEVFLAAISSSTAVVDIGVLGVSPSISKTTPLEILSVRR